MSPEPLYFTTNQPGLIWENNAVGRMKKEIWEASDAEIDKILADYGMPSPCEWAKPGSYIQTTLPEQLIANRHKNDIVLIPVGYAYYGITGAATSLAIAEIVVWLCTWYWARRRLHLYGHASLVTLPIRARVRALFK